MYNLQILDKYDIPNECTCLWVKIFSCIFPEMDVLQISPLLLDGCTLAFYCIDKVSTCTAGGNLCSVLKLRLKSKCLEMEETLLNLSVNRRVNSFLMTLQFFY